MQPIIFIEPSITIVEAVSHILRILIDTLIIIILVLSIFYGDMKK